MLRKGRRLPAEHFAPKREAMTSGEDYLGSQPGSFHLIDIWCFDLWTSVKTGSIFKVCFLLKNKSTLERLCRAQAAKVFLNVNRESGETRRGGAVVRKSEHRWFLLIYQRLYNFPNNDILLINSYLSVILFCLSVEPLVGYFNNNLSV